MTGTSFVRPANCCVWATRMSSLAVLLGYFGWGRVASFHFPGFCFASEVVTGVISPPSWDPLARGRFLPVSCQTFTPHSLSGQAEKGSPRSLTSCLVCCLPLTPSCPSSECCYPPPLGSWGGGLLAWSSLSQGQEGGAERVC